MKPFLTLIAHFFVALWNGAKPQLVAALSNFLTTFVHDDLGALFADAVELIQTSMPDASGEDKKAAALAKVKADAQKAGGDLLKEFEALSSSLENFFLESAVQTLKSTAA